jgi:hypothetical protein
MDSISSGPPKSQSSGSAFHLLCANGCLVVVQSAEGVICIQVVGVLCDSSFVLFFGQIEILGRISIVFVLQSTLIQVVIHVAKCYIKADVGGLFGNCFFQTTCEIREFARFEIGIDFSKEQCCVIGNSCGLPSG